MTYEIVQVMRYAIVREGRIVDQTRDYTSREQAQQVIRDLEARDAAATAKKERERLARSRPGKWTPESLREHLAKDPRWEVEDLSDGGRDSQFNGAYRATWRDLDDKQPFSTHYRQDDSTFQVPNYALYGPCYIVRINDAEYSGKGAQFALRDTSIESGLEYEYVTIDRLAAALIRRGIMEPPAR